MNRIELLEKETIDRIAAGEVVERPASVVKELVENAVDAGASAVTIDIREGGKKQIRITDNGEGIPADQISLAFLRHATSKIRQASDLQHISSLGFRGEALSSIAAVSRVECISRTKEAICGIRYLIEGGTERSLDEIGAPAGTTFIVRDLFFNTPARGKFLLSAAAEGSRVRSIVEKLALSHPEISFSFIVDGRTGLVTSGNGKIKDVVYQIYGREIAGNLIPFRTEQTGVRIGGYIGTAQIARGNRAGEVFFVNDRAVLSDVLTRACEEGYHGFLMQHRYPFVLLYLEVDGSLVDVNVHPAKLQVRFSEKETIFRTLCSSIQETLLAGEHIPEASIRRDPTEKKEMLPAPEPFEEKRRERLSVQEPSAIYGKEEKSGSLFPAAAGNAEKKLDQHTAVYEEKVLSREARPYYRLIGQVFETYWLMEYKGALYIIDQHAAHEKVLYERLMQQYREKKVTSQMICPAVVIEPGAAEALLIRERLPVFTDLGFEIEEFGGDAFKISAVPANLYRIDPQTLFTDILDQFREEGEIPSDAVADRLASMACKAAVKGNMTLSVKEAEVLFDELLLLENPYHCPHGRPTIISMTREDLEKSFKRIV